MLNLDVEHMTELATKWGGVPRRLLGFLTNAEMAEYKIHCTAKSAVRECNAMLYKAESLDLPHNAFYFIRPQKTPENICRMFPPWVSVLTQTLRSLLAEALEQEPHATKLDFFNALRRQYSEETCQLAHDIYKSWLHSFISTQGMTMECEWLLTPGSHGSKTRMQNLQGTPTVISAIQDAPAAWTPPFYWIPTTRNFPGIDSALILKKEIVAIRVVLANRHHSPPETGLMELSNLLPDNMKGHAWKLLFVEMGDEYRINDIAKRYYRKIVSPTNKSFVQVGRSVVDPVQNDVIYKVCKLIGPSSIF